MIKKLFIFAIACFCMLSFSNRISVPDDSGGAVGGGRSIVPVRAVSLGGWLIVEGWIKPSLFLGIPNRDLLDGTQVQFKSIKVGKYLSTKNGGGTIIVANGTSDSNYEEITFTLWRINKTSYNFKVYNKKFVGLNTGNEMHVVPVENAPSRAETFEIHRNPNDLRRVRIKASNGFFLQVKTGKLVTADYEGNGGWGVDDPSVFLLNTMGAIRGEYQVTNGYGPLAPQAMKEHWDTFIVEEDFKFISDNGLNAVRIPVGWWIAYDPNPPKPYVGGSLQALDNAFTWAEKNGIKVIIDLHAAPGSQNGLQHSSSRDGSLEWGQTDESIQQTIYVIDFLTARYAKSPSLFAVGLLNEPLGISLDTLTKFYRAGYDVVRKHSPTAYVILSDRMGRHEPKELFNLAKGFSKVAIDVHYYNLFANTFNNFTIQQNIDYVYNNRSKELSEITTSDGPLIFVGEWSGELDIKNGTDEDYQRYVEAQLQIFGRATFGWAFWTLRNVYNRWSLEWMIKNGYIKL